MICRSIIIYDINFPAAKNNEIIGNGINKEKWEDIAYAIRDYCPDAWVINYTNPMTLCVDALYHAFPQIKAYGCCYEVYEVKDILRTALKDILGIEK